MVIQEKGTKTSESAFRGETVRKFSGCKLLQSRSWARGHESVVTDGSVEKPHRFCSVTLVLLSEGDLVYVDPAEGLYELCFFFKRFEGRFSTLP